MFPQDAGRVTVKVLVPESLTEFLNWPGECLRDLSFNFVFFKPIYCWIDQAILGKMPPVIARARLGEYTQRAAKNTAVTRRQTQSKAKTADTESLLIYSQ